MRTQTLLTFLGATALSASAFAGPATAPDASGTGVMSVQLVPGAGYKLGPGELDGMQGTYNMADGQVLRITSSRRKAYAEIGQVKTELVPVAKNTFTSRDEGMTLVFDQIPFATDVTMISNAK